MARDAVNMSLEEQEVLRVFSSLSPSARELFVEVIRLEKAKVHMKTPIGIVDDIVSQAKALIK